MTAYRKDFDETKYMFFFIQDDELLILIVNTYTMKNI